MNHDYMVQWNESLDKTFHSSTTAEARLSHGYVFVLESGLNVRLRALVGDIVICSWARHLHSASQCLLPPRCINANIIEFNAGGNPAME